MKSLKAMGHALAAAGHQLELLDDYQGPEFTDKLGVAGLSPFHPTAIEIFQVNLGKMCNQTCRHCHVDAGPDRKEIMTRATMQQCLDALAAHPNIRVADLTGGAPEMNPDFRWFVEELRKLDLKVMVRCNLTIIEANKKYNDLPGFFRRHQVEVVCSLPFYTQSRTDRQRGDGVFEASISALQKLNEEGYGMPDSGLVLNLVYNPAGAFLPPGQPQLEAEYKLALAGEFGIRFNNLFVITNMPISRYLDYLLVSGNYLSYMEKLVNAFNPAAALNVMCRNTISVGWDGYLYDCDFNQMLDLKLKNPEANHIADFHSGQLISREIITHRHCFGCTAGAGSSCGGEVV